VRSAGRPHDAPLEGGDGELGGGEAQ